MVKYAWRYTWPIDMSKYGNFARFLGSRDTDRVRLSFSEIEEILRFPLPASARKYRAWWANDRSHVEAASGWMNLGWKVASVDLSAATVTFEKLRDEGADRAVATETRRAGTRVLGAVKNAYDFEALARRLMSSRYGVALEAGVVPPVPKMFDLVSRDGEVVGDAKWYTMVRGRSIPPAKFSVIAEHVWMLQHLEARERFLVFGNDRRVPVEWLKRYGELAGSVQFYFLHTATEKLEILRT
jgi:hypothetical protein